MLENGDRLPYLGEEKVLTIIREPRNRAKVKSAAGRILMWVPYEADYRYKQRYLEKWYRKQAYEVFSQKAEAYAQRLSVHFVHISIKDQKSRWGSCSSKGNLNFNWRILMAPEAVCDYVILHELCHLVFLDHSAHFWKLLESICPLYRQHKKWLKDNGQLLYPF